MSVSVFAIWLARHSIRLFTVWFCIANASHHWVANIDKVIYPCTLPEYCYGLLWQNMALAVDIIGILLPYNTTATMTMLNLLEVIMVKRGCFWFVCNTMYSRVYNLCSEPNLFYLPNCRVTIWSPMQCLDSQHFDFTRKNCLFPGKVLSGHPQNATHSLDIVVGMHGNNIPILFWLLSYLNTHDLTKSW